MRLNVVIPKKAALACSLSLLAASCAARDESAPPLFGGQGALVVKEQPLPPEAGAETSRAGPCGAATTPGDVALLDDFEDGDHKLFKAFQREGWWFAAQDNTEGATLRPPGGAFAAERLAAPDGSKDNLFAAHFIASGQKEWGVVWGTTLSFAEKGVRCPFNASSFGGIRLRAKGPGTVRITLAMPETTPPSEGGQCKSSCYDAHGKLLFLSDKWDDYVIPWDKLQQDGWGTQARFDASRLLNLSFKVDPKQLPADFWVDDIKLLPKTEAVAKAP